MDFYRTNRNLVHLQRMRLRELVAAVQTLEAKGYECIVPIKRKYKQGKRFENKMHLLNGISPVSKKHFVDSYETVSYETYMKKVE